MTDAPKQSRDAVNTIFGDELPEATSDERDIRSPDDDAEHEQWLRDNIPPHHD